MKLFFPKTLNIGIYMDDLNIKITPYIKLANIQFAVSRYRRPNLRDDKYKFVYLGSLFTYCPESLKRTS